MDLGSYVAGPAAATVMSDFGADVVKVEPLTGDAYRTLLGGVLAEYPDFFWDQDSRNKRSLAIDFTTQQGREAIDRLIRRSDVVITNYLPQLLSRLNDVLTEVEPGPHFYAYTVNSPFWMSGAEKRTPRLAPGIGEHTREILVEIGFDGSDVDAMLAEGIALQREED